MPLNNRSQSPFDRIHQATYVWSLMDPRRNRLIRDKLLRTTLTVKKEIEKEARSIRHENRFNSNQTGVDQQIAGMWAAKIQAHAGMTYEQIFSHHWRLLGHEKTGAFVRACSAILGRYIEQLGSAEAHKARDLHRRQGGVRMSLEGTYKECARLVRKQFEGDLDIEARELDLAESVAHAKKTQAAAPIQPKHGQNLPVATPIADSFAIVDPGEIVVEGGPLSTDRDTAAASIALLQKLGFGKKAEEWPSSSFGPVLPEVLRQLKRAHKILTTRGFVFVEDPLNPQGDGKSWLLKCEPPIELPNGSDPTRFAQRCLQKDGIKVPIRPVLEGETLLIPLWGSGADSSVVPDDLETVGDKPTIDYGIEQLGEQMGVWNQELKSIARAAQAKRRYTEEIARGAFPLFTLWKAIDGSSLTTVRRGELFGQACQKFGSQEGRFELIGELTGNSPFTAYDIYKKRPSRKKRSQKK